MKNAMSHAVAGSMIVATLLAAITFLDFYRNFKNNEIAHQIGCIHSKGFLNISANICSFLLFHGTWSAEQIEEINNHALVSIVTQDVAESPDRAEEYLKLFLSKGVDINARSQRIFRHGPDGAAMPSRWTALHIAALLGNVEEVALLLKYGADKSMKDEDGKTPLDLAEMKSKRWPDNERYKQIIKILHG